MDHNDGALLARVATQIEMHILSDEKSDRNFETLLGRIANAQEALVEKFDSSIRRVHDKIESENKVALLAAAEAKKHAQDAHDKISREKIKLLVVALGWLSSVGGILGFAGKGHGP